MIEKLLALKDFLFSLTQTQLVIIVVGMAVVIGFLMAVAYGIFLIFGIRKIQKSKFALLRKILNDSLYEVHETSSKLLFSSTSSIWKKIGVCGSDDANTPNCDHIQTSFGTQVHLAKVLLKQELIDNNREVCLNSIRENGYDKLTGEQLDQKIELVGTRIYKQALNRLRSSGLYSLQLFTDFRPQKFSSEQAIEMWKPVVYGYLALKEEEKREVKQLIVLPLTFWKWFKKELLQ